MSFRGQGCCFQSHATGKAAEVPHTQRHQVVVLEFNSVNAAHLGCTPAGCQAAPLAHAALSMPDAGCALRTRSSGRGMGLSWRTELAAPSDVSGLAAFDLAPFSQLPRGRTRGLCVSGSSTSPPLHSADLPQTPALGNTGPGPWTAEHSQYGLVLLRGMAAGHKGWTRPGFLTPKWGLSPHTEGGSLKSAPGCWGFREQNFLSPFGTPTPETRPLH